jgi:predicted RNA-binding Zn-ribbon protein involved in translation (DUF1610 family)
MCYEYDDEGERRRVRVAQDVDPSEAGSIQEVERDAREFGEKPPELAVAASGERYNDCGEESPLLACPNCGTTMEVGRTCRRAVCPRCWESWDFQRSLDAGTALEGERRYRYASGERKTKLHHLVVSLPRSLRFGRSDPLDAAFRLAILLLAQVGVFAGWLVYHPWRIKKEYRGRVNGHESGNGEMTWADILTLIESDGWEAVREEYLVYGPHFHVIANARYVQGGAVTDMIYEKTGVLIHRITKGNSSVSIGNLEDLMSATAYSLSHAGLSWDEENEVNRAAFRFFGSTANVERRQNVKDDVDAALRAVSPEVLGVEFASPRCEEETVDEEAVEAAREEYVGKVWIDGGAASRAPVERARRGLSSGSGGSSTGPDSDSDWSWPSGNTGGFATENETGAEDSWTASAGVSPSYLSDPSEAEESMRSRCGAKLAPIWAAEEWLEDEEWVAERDVATLDKLRAALETYHERPSKPPAPPPDAPDPPE